MLLEVKKCWFESCFSWKKTVNSRGNEHMPDLAQEVYREGGGSGAGSGEG